MRGLEPARDRMPGASGLAVGALIVMHVVVAAMVVAVLHKTLPVADRH